MLFYDEIKTCMAVNPCYMECSYQHHFKLEPLLNTLYLMRIKSWILVLIDNQYILVPNGNSGDFSHTKAGRSVKKMSCRHF